MRAWRARDNSHRTGQAGRCPVAGEVTTCGEFLAAALRVLVVLVAVISMSACSSGSDGSDGLDGGPIDKTTILEYSPVEERWVAQVSEISTIPGEDPSHDIIIRLEDDEPVKEITLRQVLLVDSSSSNAELIISGRHNNTDPAIDPAAIDTMRGSIRICNLVFLDVDAETFEVYDTDVVRLDLVNVSSENDLSIEITPVNTIRCGRGGTAVLSLGEEIPLTEEMIELGEGRQVASIVTTSGRQGLRATRIHILGPSGGTGFIENLIIERTSVFGKIELRDLEIQELFMKNVTVEDSI